MIWFTCSKLKSSHRSRSGISLWMSPKTQLFTIHPPRLWMVNDFCHVIFVDLLTAATTSRIQAWRISVQVSKDSVPYDQSISILNGRWSDKMNLLTCSQVQWNHTSRLNKSLWRAQESWILTKSWNISPHFIIHHLVIHCNFSYSIRSLCNENALHNFSYLNLTRFFFFDLNSQLKLLFSIRGSEPIIDTHPKKHQGKQILQSFSRYLDILFPLCHLLF